MTKQNALLGWFLKRERRILKYEFSVLNLFVTLLCFAVIPLLILGIFIKVVSSYISPDILEMTYSLVKIIDMVLISMVVGKKVRGTGLWRGK